MGGYSCESAGDSYLRVKASHPEPPFAFCFYWGGGFSVNLKHGSPFFSWKFTVTAPGESESLRLPPEVGGMQRSMCTYNSTFQQKSLDAYGAGLTDSHASFVSVFSGVALFSGNSKEGSVVF